MKAMTHDTQRPRVLLLHNFLSPYRLPLFAELARRFDLEVWILGDVKDIREWPGAVPEGAFRCRLLPHVGLPTGSRDYRILLNYSLPFLLTHCAYDVLLCCGWDTPAAFWAGWTARARCKPFVLWSGSTAHEPNWRRSMAAPLVRGLVRRASAWIAYGTRAKEYLIAQGADVSRVFCAYNTVDIAPLTRYAAWSREERNAFRRAIGLATPFAVLYSGQLVPRKGLGDLLPAFVRLAQERNDVTLMIAGSGAHERRFRDLAAPAGDRVRFLGFQQPSELGPYYAASDLMALPSREEVWGLVVNEALACGVPALVTEAVGCAPDLVRDGINGYICAPGSPQTLYACLRRHFSEQTDRAAMRRASAASAAPFTISAMADAFEQAVSCAMESGNAMT